MNNFQYLLAAKVLKIFAFRNNHYALCRHRHNAYRGCNFTG